MEVLTSGRPGRTVCAGPHQIGRVPRSRPTNRRSDRTGGASGRLAGRGGSEGLHQGGDVPAVLGGQFVDAGDQQLPLLIARVAAARSAGGLVVVVHPGGLGGGGADGGNGDVEPLGEPVDGGRAGRPDQVARGGEGVDRGPGQPARRATSP